LIVGQAFLIVVSEKANQRLLAKDDLEKKLITADSTLDLGK
jgi:hypothetical protein